jgi:hypothetical protein
VGLDDRTRDNECSPAGGSDIRILLQNDRMQSHWDKGSAHSGERHGAFFFLFSANLVIRPYLMQIKTTTSAGSVSRSRKPL